MAPQSDTSSLYVLVCSLAGTVVGRFATVGAGANIGAGTIFCNYDGFRKHKTVIGPRAWKHRNSSP